ncbi:LSU ribosomal protein L5P/L11 [Giardia duodenalis assemblage B]|uniref:LSU ribosomal protein L5P/L11 n=3 Tax=Giardia intestinalis TaxID=5741 RepID=A0A132NXX4_GIAIN|nr:Ribosomal protein L11 [Giardia intestinalis ATCC 50581]KWX14914.1 LSU ribosomal protein L5P/L11 [Giardia intestinalis assemblage B]
MSQENENPMRRIRIEKLVLNICIGGEGDALTKAAKVLQQLTDQEPTFSKSRLTIRGFGIRRGQKISTHVTVRGEKAREIIERGLRVKNFELPYSCFSTTGNFGFGITEHIDLGIKYDPSMGIYGMDFYVVLSRPGFRVNKRRAQQQHVGASHKITPDEARAWVEREFEVVYTK